MRAQCDAEYTDQLNVCLMQSLERAWSARAIANKLTHNVKFENVKQLICSDINLNKYLYFNIYIK